MAAANSSLRLKVISADTASTDDAISAEMANTEAQASDGTSDEEMPAQYDSSLTDGGELNVQALISMAMSAAIAPSPEQPAAPAEDAPTEQQDLPTLQAVLASMESDARASVGLSTASGTSDGTPSSTNPGMNEDPSTLKQPAKIAALQAVGWFDGAAVHDDLDTPQTTTSEASVSDSPSEAVISKTGVDAVSQQDHHMEAARPKETDELLNLNLQTASPLNGESGDEEPGARPSGEGDVSADQERRRAVAEAEELAAQSVLPPQPLAPQDSVLSTNQNLAQEALNSAAARNETGSPAKQNSGHQSDNSQNFSLPAADSGTNDSAQPETSKDNGGANSSASPKATGASSTHAGGMSGSTLATAEISPAQADALLTEQGAENTEWTPNKTGPQDPDARQLKSSERKALDDKDIAEKREASIKGDVNIRELMKLGATDVALSFAQPDMPAAEPRALDQPLPPIAPASQQTTAQHAAPIAAANIETNGERRTIADDIRLRALERMVVNAARNGTQILSIQLYPPGLGQVVLRLAMDGQRLRLATRAATMEAADTLRNMEADLRDALAGNGLQLAGFDVSEEGPNDEAPRREPVEPVVKTRSGGTKESFIVDLNA